MIVPSTSLTERPTPAGNVQTLFRSFKELGKGQTHNSVTVKRGFVVYCVTQQQWG